MENQVDNTPKAGGPGNKWGPDAHFALLMGLNAVLEKHSIKATIRDHLELIFEEFQAQGLDNYSREAIR